jgi:hypothetical protein
MMQPAWVMVTMVTSGCKVLQWLKWDASQAFQAAHSGAHQYSKVHSIANFQEASCNKTPADPQHHL